MSSVAQERGSPASTDSVVGVDQEPSGVNTWHIFLLVNAVWLAISLYANERVLAPEVMAGVVERTNGVDIPVSQLDQIRRQGRWAYLILPIVLATRVGAVALTLQLISMLIAHALPFRVAFRASLWGFGAVAYGTFVRILRLDLLPAGTLTTAELAVVPDSLAVILSVAWADVPVLSATLSALSLHDAFWIGIVTAYLTTLTGFGRRRAVAVALGAWCTTALARVGAQIFMIAMIG